MRIFSHCVAGCAGTCRSSTLPKAPRPPSYRARSSCHIVQIGSCATISVTVQIPAPFSPWSVNACKREETCALPRTGTLLRHSKHNLARTTPAKSTSSVCAFNPASRAITVAKGGNASAQPRSEAHTSELQSLQRNSFAAYRQDLPCPPHSFPTLRPSVLPVPRYLLPSRSLHPFRHGRSTPASVRKLAHCRVPEPCSAIPSITLREPPRQNRHRASAHSIPPHARSRSRRWETPRHSHPSDSVAQPTRQARCQWPARRVAPSAGPRKSGISMVAAVERTASWMVPTPPQEAPSPPHSPG